MLDDALAAELFDGAVALDGDEAVLDVELAQAAAVVGDGAHALVRHQFAALDAQLLQVGTVFGQQPQAAVGDVALAQVQRPQPRAAARQHLQRRQGQPISRRLGRRENDDVRTSRESSLTASQPRRLR